MDDSNGLTFWEHLDVLRGSIIKMLIASALAGIAAFCLKDELFAIVLAPCDSSFFAYRLLQTEPFSIHLINTGLTEQFMIHVKVALVAGMLCASPYLLYVLFRFISPALYANISIKLISIANKDNKNNILFFLFSIVALISLNKLIVIFFSPLMSRQSVILSSKNNIYYI